jgi:hypothetical protein
VKARFYIACTLTGIGMTAVFTGIFSAQPDIQLGVFGIPAIYILEAGITIMIVGLIVMPNRGGRASIFK